MNDWSESDLAGMELCKPHGERLKFCRECSEAGSLQQVLGCYYCKKGDHIHCTHRPSGVGAYDLPEAAIQEECTKLLEEDGWRPLRTDPVSDRGRGKGFGELGMADHLYVRYHCDSEWRAWWKRCGGDPDNLGTWKGLASAQVIWIEFKRPGEKPAKHQIAWHTKERARGALTLIAGEDFHATVQGFREWYATSGLMRRARWW